MLKTQKLIKVKEPHSRNNGDIEIIPSEGRFTGIKHAPEEIIAQGLRYQVPEQVVILDFWTKVKRDRYGHLLEDEDDSEGSVKGRGETPQTSETFDFSDSSSLTSIEASPEPSRPLELHLQPQASTSSAAMGEAADKDGAELLWLFAHQRQIEREGTEVSHSKY